MLFDISLRMAFLHYSFSVGSVYPVNAIIGGVMSQEVIKVLSSFFSHLPYSIFLNFFRYFSLSWNCILCIYTLYLNLGWISYAAKINGLSEMYIIAVELFRVGIFWSYNTF